MGRPDRKVRLFFSFGEEKECGGKWEFDIKIAKHILINNGLYIGIHREDSKLAGKPIHHIRRNAIIPRSVT